MAPTSLPRPVEYPVLISILLCSLPLALPLVARLLGTLAPLAAFLLSIGTIPELPDDAIEPIIVIDARLPVAPVPPRAAVPDVVACLPVGYGLRAPLPYHGADGSYLDRFGAVATVL
jgi:hypothetical protein